VEHVHTLLSMFGGKELDVNVHKAIASPEDAAQQQDDDDAAAAENDGIQRQKNFNTFNISTRVRVRCVRCVRVRYVADCAHGCGRERRVTTSRWAR
jgi:hypothetical protein